MISPTSGRGSPTVNVFVQPLDSFGRDDVEIVGGKNSSLGEMLGTLKSRGVRVPDGIAVTVAGYREYIAHNGLEGLISETVEGLVESDDRELAKAGNAIRRAIGRGEFPPALAEQIRDGYAMLSREFDMEEADVAVRSSATAEDLPDASFAGQQETMLNVAGADDVLDAVRYCYASLFTDRAIAYRARHGFDHSQVGLSVGIQKMVRSGKAGSGVMFTLDPDTGFPDVVVVNASWGLGEHLVQGNVEPDEWMVFKPTLGTGDDAEPLRPIIDRKLGSKLSKEVYATGEVAATKIVDCRRRERESFVLTDDEVVKLARWGAMIEEHYGHPMDIEWAKDGDSGELFVVQARPETVQSRSDTAAITTYKVRTDATPLVRGTAVGGSVATGTVRILSSMDESGRFGDGDVLVTEMTDPDWGPVLARAGAVVTDRGGRTAHAAIISRELGIPAVVGTDTATAVLEDGMVVTVSCAEGDDGRVYDGTVDWDEIEVDLQDLPETQTDIMLILASPGAAFRWWKLPADGVGLARTEFIVTDHIQAHPLALLHFDDIEDPTVRATIEEITVGYDNLGTYFVDRLSSGIARIAASRYPAPVIVRMSDFKSNEYADLIGGTQFEPIESNPMLGWRGASRYADGPYQEAFGLECKAIRIVREEMGLDNVVVMLPFVRTLEEADSVMALMEEHGLKRGLNGLEIFVMAEIPANVFLADQFAERFDGFSIGSNDMTQLVLGVDRDSSQLAHLFDERNPAVLAAIERVIAAGRAAGRKVGICGQGPSDHPDLAEFLVRHGIDSIAVNPDALAHTRRLVAAIEADLAGSP
ncbi:MAG: phosphoenolpyruvate synthase [Acidimicrobiia bacterium]|nr:phosphoenolpyruvate synthase [Acidimicrobiia bacterium]MBT8240947.1 phosphoenolpyruvate synthase [Acidimicrobiia bacterium]